MFAWVNGELAQGRASAGRIAAVLAAPAAVAGGTAEPPTPVTGALALRGVRPAGPPAEAERPPAGPAPNGADPREPDPREPDPREPDPHGRGRHGPCLGAGGLDLAVAPGELLGVACVDPAAARALVDWLGRERDPGAGEILLDGRDVRSLAPAGVRAAILAAPHDADLFTGTLLDNLAAGDPVPEPGRLAAALSAAGADEVSATLPDGLAGALSERGRSLSGGQRQRVALARALCADPPVLVLHDPTTAVDAVTELRVAEGLRRLRQGRTTLLVTTSPALLSVADRVVYVDGGAVVASGTHADLVAREPAYRATVLG
jgi:putative ABC transport system ATP-binding protein